MAQAPKRRVDLDLDAVQPPPRTLRFKGEVRELPGSIAISTVNRLLQLQDSFRADDDDDDVESSTRALNEMYQLVMDLFRQRDPDIEDLDLSIDDMVQITGLVVAGVPISLDEAVALTLQGEPEVGEDGKPVKTGPPPKKATARRSRSRKPSPVRS